MMLVNILSRRKEGLINSTNIVELGIYSLVNWVKSQSVLNWPNEVCQGKIRESWSWKVKMKNAFPRQLDIGGKCIAIWGNDEIELNVMVQQDRNAIGTKTNTSSWIGTNISQTVWWRIINESIKKQNGNLKRLRCGLKKQEAKWRSTEGQPIEMQSPIN